MMGSAGQVAFWLRSKLKKKEQAPRPIPSVAHEKHHCFRDALSKTLALWRVSVRALLGITAYEELFSFA